jgi:hypothetical protein
MHEVFPLNGLGYSTVAAALFERPKGGSELV